MPGIPFFPKAEVALLFAKIWTFFLVISFVDLALNVLTPISTAPDKAWAYPSQRGDVARRTDAIAPPHDELAHHWGGGEQPSVWDRE